MSQNAGRLDRGGNDVQKAGPGEMLMDQKRIYSASPMSLAGNQTIPPEAILSGIVLRAGPVGAYADIFPSADSILAACPALDVGDSFEFLFINSVAQANTPTAGAGITLVNGNVTASLVKRYMVTCLAGGRTQNLQVTTTNGSNQLNFQTTGISPSQAARLVQSLQPGMLASGTGIPGGATIVGVNSVTGTVTLSANASASGTVAGTFSPSVEIRGLYQAAQ